MSLDVTNAVKKAVEYANVLFSSEELRRLMLEEVEYDDTKEQWLVTLGFDTGRTITKTESMSLFPSTTREIERRYKIFQIDAESGILRSMKMRLI